MRYHPTSYPDQQVSPSTYQVNPGPATDGYGNYYYSGYVYPHPSYPYQAQNRPIRRQGGFSTHLILTLIGLGFGLALATGLPVLWFAYYQVSAQIVPGVSAGPAHLGGKTLTQAAIEIERTWNFERTVTIEGGGQPITLLSDQLGLRVDSLETARLAYAVGHDQTLTAEAAQMLYARRQGWGIAPAVTLDQVAARAQLETLAPQLNRPPQDASLRLDGNTFIVIPGQAGYALDIEAAMTRLAVNPQLVLMEGRFPAVFQPVEPRITDVSAALAEAQRLINTPVHLFAYDPIRDELLDWTVPFEVIASWLVVTPSEIGPQIGLDQAKVATYLSERSNSLDEERFFDPDHFAQPVADAVRQGSSPTILLSHNPTRYVVTAGDTLLKIGWKVGMPYYRILQANPGIDPNALTAGQELVIPSKDELLPLPVVANKRIVISIGKQRLWTYQDGELLKEYIISTGIDRSPTQPGIFQVQTHEENAYASVWDLYMPNFLGIYESWPGFMNGIHGLPTLSNGRRLWANILGNPASYGCIILDLDDAETVYSWAENGVIVEIKP